jgi:hypothetical protein
VSTSTTEGIRSANRPVTVWLRRTTLGALGLFVLAGMLTLLGVHTARAGTERDGYTLSLRYPRIARAGLDVPWELTVTHPGGFGKQVSIAVTGTYLNLFETQGFHPDPSDQTRDGKYLYLTFQAPPGDTFVVYFDTYVQPGSQAGSSARVAVVEGTRQLAWIDYSTWLWP